MTSVDNEQALAAFERSSDPTTSERLRAARFLAKYASSAYSDRLSAIRANENNPWVRQALGRALSRAQVTQPKPSIASGGESEEAAITGKPFDEDVRALAVEETSAILLHQLRPLVGLLELAANDEIDGYSSSRTKTAVDQIRSFLEAMDGLRKASEAPIIEDFDLTDLVVNVAEYEVERGRAILNDWVETPIQIADSNDGADQTHDASTVTLSLPRREPVVTTGAPALIELAVKNALTNAVEATLAVQGSDRNEIILNWGVTDRDSWIVVLDEGCGLPSGFYRMMQPGESTKKGQGNLGMGLPIAFRAIESIGGSFKLAHRSDSGVACEIRWPRRT